MTVAVCLLIFICKAVLWTFTAGLFARTVVTVLHFGSGICGPTASNKLSHLELTLLFSQCFVDSTNLTAAVWKGEEDKLCAKSTSVALTQPSFFPSLTEHGSLQEPASVRDADCGLWGLLAYSPAPHHYLRLCVEVSSSIKRGSRAYLKQQANKNCV